MRSLGKTMQRRAFGYVMVIILIVTFAGAAGMYALENPNPGFRMTGDSQLNQLFIKNYLIKTP